MLRPVEIDKVFNLSIDAYICLWGGLLSPRLCLKELNDKLSDFNFLLTMGSSISEDTHISKQQYFDICLSDVRLKEVSSIACCMMVVFAYENLKNHPKFEKIKVLETVKFLRHLRNAAAHGNKFCFMDSKSRTQVDPGFVTWRSKTIELNLENKVAFPDFLPHGDIPYLFEDITELLK